MTKTVYRVFINFEKEERWLNSMAAKGLHLVHYSFCRYVFMEGKPGEYIYRLELLDELPSHPKSKEYLSFMEDAGVETVATYFRWVFFRKKAEDGPFELHSDLQSRIEHYERICLLLGIVAGANLLIGFSNLIGNSLNSYLPWLNIGLAGVLAMPLFSYYKKLHHLKKEKLIRE